MKYIKSLELNEESNEVVNEAVNPSGYIKAGKLGYNDQFLGRRSLSYTLSTDLGMNPKNEFGGGDWLGFDHVSLYSSGGRKTGTILDDALTGKYTYEELKKAAADFLGIKESVNEAKKFKPGDKWSNDFDYDGMLKFALTVNEKTPIKKLNQLFDSATDVNYHTPFRNLGIAIDWIEDGDKAGAKDYIKNFHEDIKKEIKSQS